jgi:alpha-N-arabinofuranosidase
VGNEDQFDRNAGNYNGRFAQFYDAIKAKYPNIQVIATTRVTGRTPDVLDNHLYVGAGEVAMQGHFHDYDNSPRTGSKIFEGEWATRGSRASTPNMADALGDAAFLMGLEHNSDLVIMESYAPLFVNVSDVRTRGGGGSQQWEVDLIGYDALGSYGSPSYYVQKMFSVNHGDEILATTIENVPTAPARDAAPAGGARRGGATAQPTIFTGVTRDSKTQAIYVKVVNSAAQAQDVHVEIQGASAIASTGQITVMAAASPEATNSIKEPKKVTPVTSEVTGLGKSFTRSFPPYSVTVLQLQSSQ